MKPEIAEKWAVALESGEYVQAQHMLKSSLGFCCLGVLCDLYSKDVRNMWPVHSFGQSLPSEVQEWAGMFRPEGVYLTSHGFHSLVLLNDKDRANFAEIASIIREKVAEL